MHTCQIQWIDDAGKPTPDTNPAVAVAVSTIDYRDGRALNVRKFHICADHLAEKVHVADCRDGSAAWSSSTNHRGLCSGHGGVASYADGSPVKSRGARKTEYR